MSRPPSRNVSATSTATFTTASHARRSAIAADRRRRGAKTAGSSTSTSTVKRSSTTSQPTAMWPAGVCRSPWSASTRMSTTVLATERARPKTSPADQPHPHGHPDQGPEQRRDEALPDRPGDGDAADGQQLLEVELQAHAEHQQDDADLGELVRQAADSATKPGVFGPTTNPASR